MPRSWLFSIAIIAVCAAGASPLAQARNNGRAPARQVVQTATLEGDVLRRADYNPNQRTLTLFFDDGSTYVYSQVPQNVFNQLRASTTKAGPFFNQSIKGRFAYKRLTPLKPKPPRAAPNRLRGDVTCPAQMTRQAIRSVVLDGAAYDRASRCLVLYFDSKDVYRYAAVPPALFQRLTRAGAKVDQVFNEEIRGKFKYQRVQ